MTDHEPDPLSAQEMADSMERATRKLVAKIDLWPAFAAEIDRKYPLKPGFPEANDAEP